MRLAPLAALLLALPAFAENPATDAGWLERASASIARTQLELAPDRGAWTATSPRAGLSARWQDGALRVQPTAGDWSLDYEFRGVARGAASPRIAGPLGETVEGTRLSWSRGDGVTEWHRSDACGFEWGFDLAHRPAGKGPLRLAARIDAPGLEPKVAHDGSKIAFLQAGRAVLQVDGLVVHDATGLLLPARLEVDRDQLVIVVDDSRATYPVRVDPYMTSPSQSIEIDAAGAQFGFSASSAGDVNGDGYGDVLVGARTYVNGAGQAREGAAFVFFGSASGVDSVPDWRVEGNQFDARLGTSVASAGDVNRDGFDDLVVGAPWWDSPAMDAGAAFVFHGSAAFGGIVGAAAADRVILGDEAAGHFAESVSSAGDVNGDAFADVIVGEPLSNRGASNSGAAFVFLGSAAGIVGATPAAASWIGTVTQADADYGIAVASAGDTNGDGYAEILVGADLFDNGQLNEGAAFLYTGGPTGPSLLPAWRAESDTANAWAGRAVAGGASINCDRYADVVIGAPRGTGRVTAHPREGWVAAWLGGPAVPGDAGLGPNGTLANADWFAESNQTESRFGWSVSAVRDESCAACADVIVGAPWWGEAGLAKRGAAMAWEGGPGGLGPTGQPHLPAASGGEDWVSLGLRAGDEHGTSVAGLPSVDGDPYDDLIVGVPLWDNPQGSEGRVVLYPSDVAASGDCDADGIPDACDLTPCNPFACNDSDFDGCDDCSGGAGDRPDADGLDTDGDGLCNVGDGDDDNDGVRDGNDNCPLVVNPSQANADGDAEGDACDADQDNDGVPNGSDNCPLNSNSGQENCNGDAQGDACETVAAELDTDGDGACNGADNCVGVPNPSQADCNADMQGDLCEPFSAERDDDGDSRCNGVDNCPTTPNAGQANCNGDAEGDACEANAAEIDSDGDGVCNGVDNCVGVANPNQADCNGDGQGNFCEPFSAERDDDTDGACNNVDNCPTTSNAGQANCNGDAEGDACEVNAAEIDSDGDGVCNGVDNCVGIPNSNQADCNSDGQGNLCEPGSVERDDDADGACNGVDPCPTNPAC